MPFTYEHENPPPPFNLDARPGLGDAVSKAYTKYCDEHPNSTQDERKRAYEAAYNGLRARFPSHREKGVTSPYAT